MRRLGKVVKWVVVGLVAVEWYARVGREFIFGQETDEWGVGETIRTWVKLGLGDPMPSAGVPGPIKNSDGDDIGWIHEVRYDEDATNPAGHKVGRHEALVEVLTEKVGRPINVALAEIEGLTLDALARASAA